MFKWCKYLICSALIVFVTNYKAQQKTYNFLVLHFPTEDPQLHTFMNNATRFYLYAKKQIESAYKRPHGEIYIADVKLDNAAHNLRPQSQYATENVINAELYFSQVSGLHEYYLLHLSFYCKAMDKWIHTNTYYFNATEDTLSAKLAFAEFYRGVFNPQLKKILSKQNDLPDKKELYVPKEMQICDELCKKDEYLKLKYYTPKFISEALQDSCGSTYYINVKSDRLVLNRPSYLLRLSTSACNENQASIELAVMDHMNPSPKVVNFSGNHSLKYFSIETKSRMSRLCKPIDTQCRAIILQH